MPDGAGVLTADQHRVYLEGHDFGRIHLRDFLSGLAREVSKRPATMVEYQRIRSQPEPQQPAKPDAKLKRTEIFRQVQALINADTTVIAETGDSWFNGMTLSLPNTARFEIDRSGEIYCGRPPRGFDTFYRSGRLPTAPPTKIVMKGRKAHRPWRAASAISSSPMRRRY
jgi:hypothetical protein